LNGVLDATTVDLAATTVRELNARLHRVVPESNESYWRISNPRGRHSVAVGISVPIQVRIGGHVGYYCGGMNSGARITIDGNAGPGVAENMMSGEVRVKGDAAQSAGATGRGGLLVIEGNAGARCGISMKGIDIVVGGSIGHMSAFMAQEGNLVVCGDAADALGDSLYEARIFVRGAVKTLGADCEEKAMGEDERGILRALLDRATLGTAFDASAFRLYGSARQLYHFHIDNAGAY
jgi:methylamine---glutamate N-methyltransferase subunit B